MHFYSCLEIILHPSLYKVNAIFEKYVNHVICYIIMIIYQNMGLLPCFQEGTFKFVDM